MTQKQIDNAIKKLDKNTKEIIDRMYYNKPRKEKYDNEKDMTERERNNINEYARVKSIKR